MVLSSAPFVRWCNQLTSSFVVESVEIETVDFTRSTPKKVLFIKLKASVRDRSGRLLHQIVLLRGDAVGILVVLKTAERGEQLLMVRQPRVAVAEEAILEIPAGMVDPGETPREVALRELKEETGLLASPEELIDLLPDHPEGFFSSVGLLDERLFLFLYEREATAEELRKLTEARFGVEAEGERITLELASADDPSQLIDSKGLLAWLLWRRLRSKRS